MGERYEDIPQIPSGGPGLEYNLTDPRGTGPIPAGELVSMFMNGAYLDMSDDQLKYDDPTPKSPGA